MNFADKLLSAVERVKNPTVVGLDTRLEYVPKAIVDGYMSECESPVDAACLAIFDFNRMIIDAVCDIVAAVKPQLAYYEMYGPAGFEMFRQTVAYAREKGLLVIADGKRGDIGSTSEAYSSAFLGRTNVSSDDVATFDADALTVNPYVGIDGLAPFIEDCKKYDKGIFVLVKTSNKSSVQVQDLELKNGGRLYEHVARLVAEWGGDLTGSSGYSSVCAVVGATWPEEAVRLREIMPNTIFLVPGYGAQGGGAADAANAFNKDGKGAVVNASRSILCAYMSDRWKGQYSENDFDAAARAEALRMRDDLMDAIAKIK